MSDDDDIVRRVGQRVQFLRRIRGMTLEDLAGRSGVGRSTISVIERGESSPTAVVLDKLARGLGVPVGDLFAVDADLTAPLVRQSDQVVWQDPGSGYVRRSISPPGAPAFQIAEISFPPGAHVTFDAGRPDQFFAEQIWVLEGRMRITNGKGETFELQVGDCLAMIVYGPAAFHNPGTETARYAVIVSTDPWMNGTLQP